MKLVVGSFISLDGIMQAPSGPNEDRSGGFAHVPARLELVETKTSSTGVVLQVQRTVGPLEYGTFDLEHPAAEIARRKNVTGARR